MSVQVKVSLDQIQTASNVKIYSFELWKLSLCPETVPTLFAFLVLEKGFSFIYFVF